MTTTHVGLAATMSTTYSDPYTVARMFGSLDHISAGRAAWNAVTTSASDAGGNFGRAHPNHALRYEIAEEFDCTAMIAAGGIDDSIGSPSFGL
jgi:alkanesulfonate monooxygenase SsuD/methylene tetrahydromethanopterin reductase-like flavin-dependent oxidoreductase (luciferase family)